MKKMILVLLLTVTLVFPRLLCAEPSTFDFSEKTPVNSALRSLILPGWGQFFNLQETKGYIVAGTAFVTVIGSYVLYSKANKTYEDYENLGIKNSSLYSDYETQQNQAMIVSILAVGTWIYAVADAYITANNTGYGLNGEKSMLKIDGFKIAMRNKALGVIYNKQF